MCPVEETKAYFRGTRVTCCVVPCEGGLSQLVPFGQDTKAYFEGTKVTCCVVPREGGTVDSLSQKMTKGNMFTHHQKTVVLDAPDARLDPLEQAQGPPVISYWALPKYHHPVPKSNALRQGLHAGKVLAVFGPGTCTPKTGRACRGQCRPLSAVAGCACPPDHPLQHHLQNQSLLPLPPPWVAITCDAGAMSQRRICWCSAPS